MWRKLSRFVSKKPQPVSALEPLVDIAVDTSFYVVGDVHGRLDLLKKMIATLPNKLPIVLVGDYVDRGENSAGVLAYLQEHPDFVCLSGNHEQMLLDFIDNPSDTGRSYLRNGGLQTLHSYGIGGATQNLGSDQLRKIRDDLVKRMGQTTIQWLRDLPHYLQVGNVVTVHAGLDPDATLQQQKIETMLWGHHRFLTNARDDGLWVVHGHTIVNKPITTMGRVSIDTGAYATGILTAAFISNNPPTFVQVAQG